MLSLLGNKIIDYVLYILISLVLLGATSIISYEKGKNNEITLEKANTAKAVEDAQKVLEDKQETENLALQQSYQKQIDVLNNQKQQTIEVTKYVHDNPEYTCTNNKPVINTNDIDNINQYNVNPYVKNN